jgi:hypothetical protein
MINILDNPQKCNGQKVNFSSRREARKFAEQVCSWCHPYAWGVDEKKYKNKKQQVRNGYGKELTPELLTDFLLAGRKVYVTSSKRFFRLIL